MLGMQFLAMATPETAVPGVAAAGMEAVMSALTTVTSLMGTVVSAVVGNEFLVIPFAAGFLAIGVRCFRMLKRAARM